jgi:ABC-2 type transport system permease protein
MNLFFHIGYFKLRSLLKLSFEWKANIVLRNLSSVFIFGGFAIGAYYTTRIGTDYLLDTAKLGSFLLHRFLSMLLFVYFVSINVGNIIVSYATFYRSPEMQYYLTKPVSHAQLFLLKFVDNFFYSSSAFFLIAFAVLLGYGSHYHMGWMFYIQTLLFMLIPFMLIAGCLAVILVLFLVRYAARIGIKKLILILVGLYISFLSGYFSLTNPLKLVARVLQHYPHLDQYFGYLDPAATRYLPNYWISESLYWTMKGESTYALSYTLLLLVTSILIFGLMLYAGKKLFYSSWLASLEFGIRKAKRYKRPLFFSLEKASHLNVQSSVLIKKEYWQFVREPSQWIHLGIISLLVLLFMGSISHINLKQNMPFLQTVSYMVVLLFNAFLIISISLRFVYPSLSIEGSNFWSVLSSPVKRNKIFWIKYLVWFVPIIILSELLVLFSHRSLIQYSLLINSAFLLMAAVAYVGVGLNLGMGSYLADYKEKNPIRAASSQSATLIFLASIIYLTLLVATTFISLNGFFGYFLKNLPFRKESLYYSVGLFTIFSFIVGTLSLIIGLRTMRRDY